MTACNTASREVAAAALASELADRHQTQAMLSSREVAQIVNRRVGTVEFGARSAAQLLRWIGARPDDAYFAITVARTRRVSGKLKTWTVKLKGARKPTHGQPVVAVAAVEPTQGPAPMAPMPWMSDPTWGGARCWA